MKYTSLSQGVFDEHARRAIAIQPIRKEVSYRDLEVISDSILSIDGLHIPMTKNAFKDVIKAVGLPVTFDKSFSEAFGQKARQQLVNRLKSVMAAKGKNSVSVVVSPESKTIIGVHKSPKDLISNESFIRTATRLIDEHSLDVNTFTVDSEGGIVIQASSPRNQWGIQGLKDEDFYGGVTLLNNPKDGFQISPYLYRLICANGMIGKSFEETIQVKSFDGAGMEKIYQEIDRLSKSAFKPSKFEAQVKLAIETKASLAEMESAYNLMKMLSGVEYKELEAWVPLQATRARYHAAGIDTIFLSPEERKNAKTGTSVWDVVNGVTHFSTHDNGYRISDTDRRRMQIEAGNLLTKKFDMGNLVNSPF